MEIAVLDLGSTTFHLEHLHLEADGSFTPSLDAKRVLSLGVQVFADGFIDARSCACCDAVAGLLAASAMRRPHRLRSISDFLEAS